MLKKPDQLGRVGLLQEQYGGFKLAWDLDGQIHIVT